MGAQESEREVTEQKYHVLSKELMPCNEPRLNWNKRDYTATHGVLTLRLTENDIPGTPWHYWEAAVFIGKMELRRTEYISVTGQLPFELMAQTPDEPLRWLRDTAIEIAREMQELANWEPG